MCYLFATSKKKYLMICRKSSVLPCWAPNQRCQPCLLDYETSLVPLLPSAPPPHRFISLFPCKTMQLPCPSAHMLYRLLGDVVLGGGRVTYISRNWPPSSCICWPTELMPSPPPSVPLHVDSLISFSAKQYSCLALCPPYV